MTSVVGILNKRGIAIAADSAVTRERHKELTRIEEKKPASYEKKEEIVEKVTNNGNKMVRLSEVIPVAVMITGNADFMRVPWDVIVRRYRQRRGTIPHQSVEACVRDFFDYIQLEDAFWNETQCNRYLKKAANWLFEEALLWVADENKRNEDFTMKDPGWFTQEFSRILLHIAQDMRKEIRSPHFEDYSLEEFRSNVAGVLDVFFYRLSAGYPARITRRTSSQKNKDTFPQEVLEGIRTSFEEALLALLGARIEIEDHTQLVFTGYGKDQKYPSLVSAIVCGGNGHRVNYSISPEDIIHINDDRPVAICPFAQDDVIEAILQGWYRNWLENASKELSRITTPDGPVISEVVPEGEKMDLYLMIKVEDLKNEFKEGLEKLRIENKREWERGLERYAPEDLAAIADSLIDLTGLQRALTFQQEGVGGIVDLAVITKDGGFKWLRRKGWYHRDQHGKDGSMGI